MALQRAEMRMVRWTCHVKLKDTFPSRELTEILGIDDIPLVITTEQAVIGMGLCCEKKMITGEEMHAYEAEGPR